MWSPWCVGSSALLCVLLGCGGSDSDDTAVGGAGATTSSVSGGHGGQGVGGSGGVGNAGGESGGAGQTGGAAGAGGSGGATACDASTLAFSSDFEAGNLDGMWVDGAASISSEQAHSGGSSALYQFSAAGHFGLTDMASYREVYVELWAYLDDIPCLSGCDSAGKHFFRFAWWPDKNGGIQKQIDTGMLNGELSAWWFDFGVPTTGAAQSYGTAVQRGVWQRIRAAFRPNAPGVADGRFVWTFDDAVVLDLTDEFVASEDALDTFMFSNYDFVAGDGITSPRIFVDDLVVRTGAGAFDCMP